MYAYLHGLLSDRKGGEIFTVFGLWHLGYIFLTIAVIAVMILLLRKKDQAAKDKVVREFIDAAFGLYVADFFLMPFAYEEIDIEKLPFHICTAMCVMCFLSTRVRRLEPYRIHFALLGFLSNLVYLIYPAGVMWHAVHPLTYRVVQTLTFHGVMTVYGCLALIFDEEGVTFRRCRRDLAVIAAMTLWALLGNTLYRGAAGKYDNDFNWFFVEADPFGLLDKSIAPYVSPFLNIAIFFAVELAIIGISELLRRRKTAP